MGLIDILYKRECGTWYWRDSGDIYQNNQWLITFPLISRSPRQLYTVGYTDYKHYTVSDSQTVRVHTFLVLCPLHQHNTISVSSRPFYHSRLTYFTSCWNSCQNVQPTSIFILHIQQSYKFYKNFFLSDELKMSVHFLLSPAFWSSRHAAAVVGGGISTTQIFSFYLNFLVLSLKACYQDWSCSGFKRK